MDERLEDGDHLSEARDEMVNCSGVVDKRIVVGLFPFGQQNRGKGSRVYLVEGEASVRGGSHSGHHLVA
jgi:hypothetical protein